MINVDLYLPPYFACATSEGSGKIGGWGGGADLSDALLLTYAINTKIA